MAADEPPVSSGAMNPVVTSLLAPKGFPGQQRPVFQVLVTSAPNEDVSCAVAFGASHTQPESARSVHFSHVVSVSGRQSHPSGISAKRPSGHLSRDCSARTHDEVEWHQVQSLAAAHGRQECRALQLERVTPDARCSSRKKSGVRRSAIAQRAASGRSQADPSGRGQWRRG